MHWRWANSLTIAFCSKEFVCLFVFNTDLGTSPLTSNICMFIVFFCSQFHDFDWTHNASWPNLTIDMNRKQMDCLGGFVCFFLARKLQTRCVHQDWDPAGWNPWNLKQQLVESLWACGLSGFSKIPCSINNTKRLETIPEFSGLGKGRCCFCFLSHSLGNKLTVVHNHLWFAEDVMWTFVHLIWPLCSWDEDQD